MIRQAKCIKTIFAQLILLGCIFCVLFGQGTHIHEITLHLTDHLDFHAHVHAHESHDEPAKADTDQDNHQHEVSTASDIVGMLTTSIQYKTDLDVHSLILPFMANKLTKQKFKEPPTRFNLPPPRSVSNQYYLSSFFHRGPPVA